VENRRFRRAMALIALTLLLGSVSSAGQAAAAPPGKSSGATCPVSGGAQIVLDPGHGGSDTGAYNQTYQLSERDLTLKIAIQAQANLQRDGYTVALTRYSNGEELGNSARADIANACAADVFIEIHLNGSSDPAVDYTQAFWGKKRKDVEFSQTMANAMSALGIPNNAARQFANGGLLQATMPSTLVEAVFLTNDEEARRLADGSRVVDIASAITSGVEGWVPPR